MSQPPSTVEFVVPAENAHIVVMLLLSNKLTFTLTSSDQTENTQKTIVSPPDIPDEPKADPVYVSKAPLTSNLAVIESICLKYITMNIEQSIPNEAQIAAEFGISPMTLKNGFKAIYGKPFYQLYMGKRIEHAKMLLLKGYKSAEIAERFGYSHATKFGQVFQKHVGLTPKQFQINHQRRASG
ncbi:helix-turn-helix domain-containing protein [Runella sp.]|uniref:AraC family transcriptional regulator n=1 Tax=Runella sp. TaxID=1960881 RepID=UPI003D10945C